MSGGRRRAYRNRHQPGAMTWNAKLVITVLVCAFVLFCAAIMLGHFLRRSAGDETDASGSSETPQSDFRNSEFSGYPVIVGKAVTFGSVLEAVGTGRPSDPSDSSSQVKPVVYNAISILLRYPEPEAAAEGSGTAQDTSHNSYSGSMPGTGMIMTYTSPVVQAVMAEKPGSVGLRDGIAALKMTSGRKYMSGVFYLAYPSLSGGDRERMRDYELSLLYELFEYGIDEVVLCGYGEEDIGEAASFTKGLKARVGERCVLGVAMPFDFYSKDDAYSKMHESGLSDAFFALDLAGAEVPALMSPESLINDRVQRIISLAVAYSLRIVVGCGKEPDPDSQVAEAIRCGAVNVQGVYKAEPGHIYY